MRTQAVFEALRTRCRIWTRAVRGCRNNEMCCTTYAHGMRIRSLIWRCICHAGIHEFSASEAFTIYGEALKWAHVYNFSSGTTRRTEEFGAEGVYVGSACMTPHKLCIDLTQAQIHADGTRTEVRSCAYGLPAALYIHWYIYKPTKIARKQVVALWCNGYSVCFRCVWSRVRFLCRAYLYANVMVVHKYIDVYFLIWPSDD